MVKRSPSTKLDHALEHQTLARSVVGSVLDVLHAPRPNIRLRAAQGRSLDDTALARKHADW